MPGGMIEDAAEAAEAAHAEKPARDFAVEHKAELTPEQQQVLDWFASIEGEKALADFRAGKERAGDFVLQRAWSILDVEQAAEHGFYGGYTISGAERLGKGEAAPNLKTINAAIRDIVTPEVEEILKDKLEPSAKFKRLDDKAHYLMIGLLEADKDRQWGGGENVVQRICEPLLKFRRNLGENDPKTREVAKHVVTELEGALAYTMGADRWSGQLFEPVVNEIARLRECSPAEVIEPIISHISANHKYGDLAMNRVMENNNYFFDEAENRYRKVE